MAGQFPHQSPGYAYDQFPAGRQRPHGGIRANEPPPPSNWPDQPYRPFSSYSLPPLGPPSNLPPPAPTVAGDAMPVVQEREQAHVGVLTFLTIRRQIFIAHVIPRTYHVEAARSRLTSNEDIYSCHFCMGVCALLFGGILFGIIALVLLGEAREALLVDPEKSKRLARSSLAMSIFGLSVACVVGLTVGLVVGLGGSYSPY